MATYHLLPTSPPSHHQSSMVHHAPVQQRKALSFAILILLVATATLITIIRFTLNPYLNGKTFVQPTNAFALQRAHLLAKNAQNLSIKENLTTDQLQQQQPQQQHQKQDKQEFQLNSYNNKKIINTVLSRSDNVQPVQIVNLPQSLNPQIHNRTKTTSEESNSRSLLKSSNSVVSSESIKLNSNSGQPDLVSPPSKSVTSLIADQRFEKDYRDDPVTISTSVKRKPRKPKVMFDANDLDETKRMKIDKDEGCGEDFGAYADLVVMVDSAVHNFAARAAIRDTWGKFAVERGAFLYFLLGSTEDQNVQNLVEEEDGKFGDILQGTFIDDYYNLTLKTITMMRWVSQKCSKIRYVLKVDDDMMMNMQHACDFSEINPNFHRVIIGKLAKKWMPHRSPSSKWYLPYKAFNRTYFPNFVTGPAYFFTGDAAQPLYETSVNKTIPFYLEDVYMTGVVAEAAGIKRYNHAMMKNVHLKLDTCSFPKIMTSHKHSPEDIRKIWKSVYYGPKCKVNLVQVRTTPKTKVPLSSNNNNSNNGNNNSNKQQQLPQQQQPQQTDSSQGASPVVRPAKYIIVPSNDLNNNNNNKP